MNISVKQNRLTVIGNRFMVGKGQGVGGEGDRLGVCG